MSFSDIEQRIAELNAETSSLMKVAKENGGFAAYSDQFKEIMAEIAELKKCKEAIAVELQQNTEAENRIAAIKDFLCEESPELEEWNDSYIRQIVDTVKVLSADRIKVILKGGAEIEWEIK